jgi:predicted alpha/beta superfamily hydrolase
MLRILLFFCALLFSTSSSSTELGTLTKVTLDSTLTNQKITVEVSLPPSYNKQAERAYPVFITAAGGSRLNVVHEQVKWLSHVSFAPIPEVIFMTMPYIDFGKLNNKFDQASGKQDELKAKVLTEEVLPQLSKLYRMTDYRVVEGFSSLSNFALYLLRYHSDQFNAFFLFAPALELDKSDLVTSFDESWKLAKNKEHFVYLNLGTFPGNKPLYESLKQAMSTHSGLSESNLVFEDMSQGDYLSGPNLGLINASRALFSDLQPDFKQFHISGIKGVTQYFSALSKKYQQPIPIDNKLVDLGFSYAHAEEYKKAIAVLKHVTELKPESTLFRIRLAQVQIQAKATKDAAKTLNLAKSMAKKDKNDEAVSYIDMLMENLSD